MKIELWGRSLEFMTKGLPLAPVSSRGTWWPVIREAFTGAWQENSEISASTSLSFYAVYACVRLISTDLAKLCLRLVEQDAFGVWTETHSPAFSPVIRKPNRYQTIHKYVESYILSKLIHGNAYVLKVRDQRRVVVGLYVLDPLRVTPLVGADGSVWYELKRDDLSGLQKEVDFVPASEIIHDTMITPYHPLIGLSPLYASGVSAQQGLSIQGHSRTFFTNGSTPGGIVTVPGELTDETVARLKVQWEAAYGGVNAGKTAILGNGMTYQASGFVNARDAELIEQLKMTAEQVCSTFGVPPYLVDIGPPPPYANFEPLLLKYHSQCIQSLGTNFEESHDVGLGLLDKVEGRQLGVEFDIDDLIWMDAVTRVNSAKTAIEGGGMSPDEARWKYHALGPTPGGKSVLAQQQNYSLAALAKRDAGDPFAKPDPVVAPTPSQVKDESDDDEAMAASFDALLHEKALAAGLYAA